MKHVPLGVHTVCIDVPSPPSPPSLPPRAYVIRDSGTCAQYISTAEECAAAVSVLGVSPYNGAYSYGNGSPPGCKTQPSRSGAYFNTDTSSTGQCTNNYPCSKPCCQPRSLRCV